MSREFRILLEIAGDVLVAIGLFLVACAGSGWCQTNLTPGIDLYITWFAIWMVPFFVYVGWRTEFDRDAREIAVCWVLCTLGMQTMLLLGLPLDGLWIIVAGYFNFMGSLWLSSKICRDKSGPQDHVEQSPN